MPDEVSVSGSVITVASNGQSSSLTIGAAAGTVFQITNDGWSGTDIIGYRSGTNINFNGNGTSGILWDNSSTGQVMEWSMNNGSQASNTTLLTSTAWTPAAAMLVSK